MTGEKDPRDVMQAEHDAGLSDHPAFRAPAEMPGVEEIARAIASWRHRSTPANPYRPSILPSEMAQASAVIALFAPILAEKETLERANAELVAVVNDRRFVRCGGECYSDDPDPNCALEGEFRRSIEALEARALAAEAALAAERERVEQLHATIRKAHVAMTMACALPGVAAEYDFSEAIASTEATLARRAAAIRARQD